MIPFKLDGADVNIPSSWMDITVKQFLSLRSQPPPDFCRMLEILTGVPYQTWFNLPLLSRTIMNQLNTALAFSVEPIDFDELPSPEIITIAGKPYAVPKDLSIKTIGQKMTFEQRIIPMATIVEHRLVLPPEGAATAVAIYMQTVISGGAFDADNLDKLIDEVGNSKAVEVLPLAGFFLRTSSVLESLKRIISSMNQEEKSLQPASMSLESSET